MNSPPTTRDFNSDNSDIQGVHTPPAARQEKSRRRSFQHSTTNRERRNSYVELHSSSAFSFLDGASLPEDLIAEAARLDLSTIALVDRNGVYGAPRFYKAARKAGIRALVGAELVFAEEEGNSNTEKNMSARSTRQQLTKRAIDSPRITLLVSNARGYRNLCKLSTAAARGRAKGAAQIDWALLEEHSEGLHGLGGGSEGVLAHALDRGGYTNARRCLDRLSAIFEGRFHIEVQRHHVRSEERRNQVFIELSRKLGCPLVATNGVRYARSEDKALYDIFSCIANGTNLDAAGRRLAHHRERHLKSALQMHELFADIPRAVDESVALAERLDFTLANLGYRFPECSLPPGETPASYLRAITWSEARSRFRPFTARARRQIEKELAMIEKLDLAGYFLIVWDIIQFCKRQRILVQGRGSAANSAVCYGLSITAVDPVKMDLLFERFLSEERGEWPDIDLDLPSGDQRERVIQYVYSTYGPHGAAMTANVITYRAKLAAREVGKALAFSNEQIGLLSKSLGRFHYDLSRGDKCDLGEQLTGAGFAPDAHRVRLFVELWQRMQSLPRHLGQHSGGMVMAAGRLDEVVPLEPASMPDRLVVQWDKDDCADLGIIKVDLLGLGMLNALEQAVYLIQRHEGVDIDLAHLPPDDPKVFHMLRQADTVGVFQVESRAQMASLPRNAPERFYDLVIQVAIIRPGPIVGGMVNPFFDRRRGREPVVYAHPSLEPILERTLGVPIFQEQLLRIAMVAAGFSGGEAEELRRAMGFKRSMERMESIEQRLRAGMKERGIIGAAQDQIVQSITSFALYGFPESHAASFALIAYASAYLKAYHPTIFCISLLNAWPMGFYHPATLIKDAQRHGVRVHPIDVLESEWQCTWQGDHRNEHSGGDGGNAEGSVRLGLRYVKGLRREVAATIVAERPFAGVDDLTKRCRLRNDDLDRLAYAGALGGFGLSRRQALWQVARAGRPAGPLLDCADQNRENDTSPLPEMFPLEETIADFSSSGVTTGPHPMSFARRRLRSAGVITIAKLDQIPTGSRIRFAGSVVVRQRPGTAKGMLFVTLEDETGMAQALVTPQLLGEHRQLIVGASALIIEGVLQRRDGSTSIKAQSVWKLEELATTPSHDFH